MIQTKHYQIKSCDDSELHIARPCPLDFTLVYDDAKTIEALLFINASLGGDASSDYKSHIAQWAAGHYSVAVVLVDYFCIGNRILTGGGFGYDDYDKKVNQKACYDNFIELPEGIMEGPDYNKFLDFVDIACSKLKALGIMKMDYYLPLSLTQIPTKNEYNNFGIMSAMDIINAQLYLQKNRPFKAKNGTLPAIMMGSSHGGYLSTLCAKIAPWRVSAVLENSCYLTAPITFIGHAKIAGHTRYYANTTKTGNLHLFINDKTMWSAAVGPRYFDESRYRIRCPLNETHLKIQAQYNKPIYISYHSIEDSRYAPVAQKPQFYDILRGLGYDAQLNMIDASAVDGKFIKNLDHGMDMSFKELLKRQIPTLLNKITPPKMPKKQITYPTPKWLYKFYEYRGELKLSCTPNDEK